jgi:hypothetical protein
MKYKIGDRIQHIAKCNKYNWGKPGIEYGIKGTIINIKNTYVSIQFDKHISGHDCNGIGMPGFCWNLFDGDMIGYKKI